MIPWSFEGEVVDKLPEGTESFVYYMEFESGHKYYGKKGATSTRRKKLVGKTRRVLTVSESNWKTYYSSSMEVKARLKAGEKLVKREIIRFCKSKSEASYWEAYYQFMDHVLYSKMFLNKWISVKVFKQKAVDDLDL